MHFSYQLRRRITPALRLLFTKQLASLLLAGLSLLRSLEILLEQESSRSFRQILLGLLESLEGGMSFYDALSAYPRLFSSFYRNNVRAGEISGTLGAALKRLALWEEKRERIHRKINSLLLYPAILSLTTVVMMIFLVVVVLPKFETIFAEPTFAGSLPPLTHFLLEMSRYGRNYFLFFLLGALLLLLIFKAASYYQPIIRGKDRLLLTLPWIGNLIRKYIISTSFHTLGSLLLHDIPMLEALEVTQQISGHSIMEHSIKMIYRDIQSGDSLLFSLRAHSLFPPMVLSMVAVGEETGKLPELLLEIASIYEEEVDYSLTQMMTLIEPCLLLLLASFVGTVVIALFLPLVTVIEKL